MKLKLRVNWRWLAMDKTGSWYIYEAKPECSVGGWACCNDWDEISNSIFNLPDCSNWKDSLHEILPDGSLKKHVERPDLKVDDRVLTKYLNVNTWVSRHFAGWSEDGDIRCWVDGRTSWTSNPDDWREWKEWKLPEDDQPCR